MNQTPSKKVDCAVIFAIEEEFNILKANKHVYLKDDNYFAFKFRDKNGVERECVATYMNEPGSHEAYKFLKEFNQIYDPYIQFIIGISGQLLDDARIGDICIAETIDKYDYNAKQKNGAVKFSGKNRNLKFTENYFLKLPNRASQLYKKWQESNRDNLNALFSQSQVDELTSKHFIRKDLCPAYFFGKIATGETVVDDPVLKEAILDKDRKLLCVDMESFGFADANEDKPNLVIIRAISDTADGRKKELDNFNNNPDAIRKWALQNAYSLFNDVLLKTVDFPQDSLIKQKDLSSSTVISKFDQLLKRHGDELFVRYSNILSHIIQDSSFRNSHQHLFETIGETLREIPSKSTIIVHGSPGSGKSTLLYLLYKYLNINGLACEYINVHNFRDTETEDNVYTFERNIKNLLELKDATYLIVDGVDQFERLFYNTDIQISRFWRQLSSKFKAIVLGVTQQDYENFDDETPQYYLAAEPKLNIELKHFDFDVPHIDELIDDLLFVTELSIDRKIPIKNFINEAKLKEVDWYSAILIMKSIGSFQFNKNRINSLGKLYYSYSKEYFSKFPSYSHPIRDASSLTFRKFIKGEKLDEKEYRSALWHFIQRSSSIKQFLISEHLVEKYSNLDHDFENSISDLKHIYSYSINVYFKDNINRNTIIQDKILQSVKKRYTQLELLQKPNICYIIGRLEDEGLKIDARKFLNEQLDVELIQYYNNKYIHDESAFRQHLLLIRTIFISLVYLQDRNTSDRYLKFLLVDREWDDLNRGFHLEYYGDKPYNSLKLGLHNDELDMNFPYTYNKLIKKIHNYIKNPNNKDYLMADIELQTITSLAVNRHLQNKLDKSIREGILATLQQFIDNQVHLIKNIEFRPYIDFSHYILSKEQVTISDIYSDIANIKNIKRSGWNFKGKRSGFEIERVVQNAESVPDHILGTMLMAMLFLPDNLSDDDSYLKDDVIKTLLIHDLAEAFTGDIRTFEKTDSHRKDEDEIMKRIFAVQNIKGFANLEYYKQLWDNYKSQSTTTAKVARELDKLEQLFQLDLYESNKENIISDYNKWRVGNMRLIDSSLGKAILNIINFKKTHN